MRILKGPSDFEIDNIMSTLTPKEMLIGAVSHNCNQYIQIAIDKGADLMNLLPYLIEKAAARGNLEFFKYLDSHSITYNNNHELVVAAMYNHIHLIKYFLEIYNYDLYTKETSFFAALIYRNNEVVDYLFNQKYIVYENVLIHLAEQNNFDGFKYIIDKKLKIEKFNRDSIKVLIAAKRYGNYKLIKYLVDNFGFTTKYLTEFVKQDIKRGDNSVYHYLFIDNNFESITD
jgi:hypothetical protein